MTLRNPSVEDEGVANLSSNEQSSPGDQLYLYELEASLKEEHQELQDSKENSSNYNEVFGELFFNVEHNHATCPSNPNQKKENE
ncbi:10433_t:CDS:2 [Funneliformis geosporum]|uniref:10433_t:CDS:1 n=1 Tax=Funneliformis geosporum TaxID=1117311 RepID=A0A9W4SUN0_9GLOM|nr:10433_t:CDS:2 [Funneliformis geosporum]